MIQSKSKKKTNWRIGLATTFAVAAFTATVTNYAVWEEDVLSNYTYTNDEVGIDEELYVGFDISNSALPDSLFSTDGAINLYDSTQARISYTDPNDVNDPSWQMGMPATGGSFQLTWKGDNDPTDGSAVVTQHVATFEAGAPANSLDVLANGDISFDNGDLFFDASNNYFGIGTTTPSTNLHLMDTFAWTRWEGTAGTWDRFVNSVSGDFVMRNFNNGGAQTFILKSDVGANALVLSDAGVGMGTFNPDAALEVERSDGKARILVEENSGVTAKRVLAKLQNNGAPSMLFTNSNSGEQWELNPNGVDHFIISNLGTGGAEVLITKATGNMIVRGTVTAQGAVLTSSRETKEAFKPVDNAEILDKVAALPITEWKFKSDKGAGPSHIGPMAEDFEEAFQLGTDGKTIGVTDMNGVTLASIQALNAENQELKERVERLEKLLMERN